MLAELEAKNRSEANARFLKAVWAGESEENLLPLVAGTGMTLAAAEGLIAKIARVKELIPQVDRLPGLRKEHAAVQERFKKVQGQAEAQIEVLEGQVHEAAGEADRAKKAVAAVEGLASELLTLHDEGLTAGAELPREISLIVARRNAGLVLEKASRVRGAASEEVERLQGIVAGLERDLANLPLSINSSRDKSRLEHFLTQAKDDLHRRRIGTKPPRRPSMPRPRRFRRSVLLMSAGGGRGGRPSADRFEACRL